MNAKEFCANVESGEVPVDCHDRVLQIAYIYSYEGSWDGDGVFDVVNKLHSRGWSFDQGDLKFNRYDIRAEPKCYPEDDRLTISKHSGYILPNPNRGWHLPLRRAKRRRRLPLSRRLRHILLPAPPVTQPRRMERVLLAGVSCTGNLCSLLPPP